MMCTKRLWKYEEKYTLREEIMAKEIVVEEKIAELKIANFD